MGVRNGTSWSGRCRMPLSWEVQMGNCGGVDWASEKHDVLIEDAAGSELLAFTFAHDEQGLRSLCRALVRLEVELVAIERPDGLLVERLLDAGLRVLALHPNQVAAARDRFRASGSASCPTASSTRFPHLQARSNPHRRDRHQPRIHAALDTVLALAVTPGRVH
jgi:hypothetical protein